ncbi:histidine phosphatase family protein [Chitinophaga lutea]
MTARILITGFLFSAGLAACKPKQPPRAVTPVSEDSTFLTGTLFLVRHAEKNPGYDSTLTGAGLIRAGKLYHLLKDSGITRIYTTPFRRTAQTGDSLRLLAHIDTVHYQPDSTGESLLYAISRHDDWGKRLLVIGHSNTLLPMLQSLGVRPGIDSIADKDYGNLFIVYKTMKGARLEKKRY